MGPTAQVLYDRAVRQVEEMTGQGSSLADVEQAISVAHEPEDEGAALWLFAWSLRAASPHDSGQTRQQVGAAGREGWQ